MGAGAMAGVGAAMQLAPYAAWGINMAVGAYGKKPEVPALTPVSPDAEQKAAIAGNQASFGDIAKLATSVNTFNQDQLNALIDRVLGPGVRGQIQTNLASQLRGEIPQDVRDAIYRSNAERGVATNAFGGGFKANINARDIGLTSLDITNKALSSAESWLSKATAPQFDVTSMFFTPAQRLAQANLQQQRQYEHDLLAAGVKAAPDPAMAAFGDVNMQAAQGLAEMGKSMMGMGMMGGGGGGAVTMPTSASYSGGMFMRGGLGGIASGPGGAVGGWGGT